MKNSDAKRLVDSVFADIQSSDPSVLFDYVKNHPELSKNQMDSGTFPKIEFRIEKDEIYNLIDSKILNSENSFNSNISASIEDPIAKLLYSIAWKNGDLGKVKHIVEGVLESDFGSKNDGLVFYQFGRFLNKRKNEPIIDQHVIRSFWIYQTSDLDEVYQARCLDALNKRHKHLIINYKSWLISDCLKDELGTTDDYAYLIDQILFALGRRVKIQRKKRQKENY